MKPFHHETRMGMKWENAKEARRIPMAAGLVAVLVLVGGSVGVIALETPDAPNKQAASREAIAYDWMLQDYMGIELPPALHVSPQEARRQSGPYVLGGEKRIPFRLFRKVAAKQWWRGKQAQHVTHDGCRCRRP